MVFFVLTAGLSGTFSNLGLSDTRIAITSFIYGCLGLTVSFLMMDYMMIQDWPQNIGGKPSFSYVENMPAFVPMMPSTLKTQK